MPGFDSPIGSKSFQGAPMREFEVPDATGYSDVPNIEEIQQFQSRMESHPHSHQHQQTPQISQYERREQNSNRLGEGAKKRIEMLLGMSQTFREVKIDSNIFVLRSLKSKEMRDALIAAFQFDGTIQGPYEIRKQLLGRSLTHVAGVEIDQFLGSSSLENRFLFIEELDESLSSRLYEEYLLLSKDAKEKYAIKTEQEAKEVAEDIKKA